MKGKKCMSNKQTGTKFYKCKTVTAIMTLNNILQMISVSHIASEKETVRNQTFKSYSAYKCKEEM